MVQGFADVFVKDSKEGGEEEPGDNGEGEGDGEPGGYVWLSLVDAVSSTMHHSWEETFEMPAESFLGLILYIKEKNRRQEEAIRKMKGQITKTY